MSPLILIQRSAKRKQRLNEAQFLMAKAYRGVPYTSLKRDPSHQGSGSVKQYRGIEYAS